MKVLLVEDESIVIKMTRFFFQVNHPEVILDVAENGEDALSLVADNPYDLILMDYGLPDMPGTEVSAKMRAIDIQAPIVGLSGNLGSVSKDEMDRAGINDAFEKPLDKEKWQQIVALCE